ncbi:MAG: HEAT repeat domain-containing protein [Candidatus Hydrogenedentes bacterium]|nr:HEAT repeat domain-containing protein [Candidatus Hydrogenedentota bacterium]
MVHSRLADGEMGQKTMRLRAVWTVAALMVAVAGMWLGAGAAGAAGGSDADGLGRSVARLAGQLAADEVEWPRGIARERAAGPAGAGVGAVLGAMLQSSSPEARINGFEALAGLACPEALDWCVLGLADPEERVREAAGRALSGQRAEDVVARALDVACSGTERQAAALDRALPRLGEVLGPGMAGVLAERTNPATKRAAAAYCLGRMKYGGARGLLAANAWSPNTTLAGACAKALLALGDAGAVHDVAALTRHGQPAVQLAAVQALGRIGGPVAAAALEEVAVRPERTETSVRAEAVRLLGFIGGPSSVPVLIDAMRAYPAVRSGARDSLIRLTGLDLGDDAGTWAAWYQEYLEKEGLVPTELKPRHIVLEDEQAPPPPP